ncbi:MAG: hypothetical protein ABIN48_11270 [Ginsengibacter sp.]
MKKNLQVKYFLLIAAIFSFALSSVHAQLIVSGTVYDSTKLYVIPNVQVYNSSGSMTYTDSLGRYKIPSSDSDSISFFYNGKFTVKFPVATMQDYQAFDISLRVRVNEKYKLLKGVTVFSNTYRRDSLENRETYSKIFGGSKPGLRSTYDPGGAAGLDIGELIGIFQFRKNKQRLAFQDRLLAEEEDRYVDHRFSSKTIERITGLKSPELEEYKTMYRPSYYFTANSTLAQFYEYILNTSYKFKREKGLNE